VDNYPDPGSNRASAEGRAASLDQGSQDKRRGPAPVEPIVPRFVRLRNAPAYFGMDKNRFNREVRPQLTEIRIGKQGRAFDRLKMEAAAEEYKRRNGVPVAQSNRRKPSWEIKGRQVSPNEAGSGMSTNCSEEHAFARALEQAICGKPRNI